MPTEITMPQLSDTMSEGTVVKWLKKEGEKVKEGEKIAEVETDKAVMEMEAFEGGTLALILAKEGDKVAVGGAIAVLASAKENAAEVKAKYADKSKPSAPAAAPAPATAAAPPATANRAGVQRIPPSAPPRGGTTATLETASSGEVHEHESVGHGATREKPTAVPKVPNRNGNDRVHVSPLARRIAADKNVDLNQVQGSGPNGRIIQRDVLAAAEKAATPTEAARPEVSGEKAAPPSPQRVSRGEKQVVPLSKMRQAIAKGLQSSKQNVPHFYVTVDVDVEALSAMRERLNAQLEAEKVRLSIGDLISKAVAVALLKHRAVNAHYNAEKNEITRFGDVHLGFAVALPDGLIVPVLRSIDQMGLKEIRQRSADLIDRARAQRLKQEEMTGATFTVSNLGTYGVREFSAIINPPSVAILAVASAEKRPVVRDGQVVARLMMTLTLSADHRAVDGAVAAEFLRTLKGLMEEPGLMLV
jgi:pyruvate dehydrogenase E2 component (dihydrolipoamide acetyltransferase)